MYEDLITALRICGTDMVCEKCGYNGNGLICLDHMMRDAADAIERLTAEIDRKDKAIQGLLTQIDKLREAYDAVHKEYGKECYAFRFGYLDQTVKLILGITEDNNEQ